MLLICKRLHLVLFWGAKCTNINSFTITMMKKFTKIIFGISLAILLGAGQAFGQITIAQDDASNYGAWAGNGGFGFGTWQITTNTKGGNYIGATGEGDPSLGLWSEDGGT